MNAYQAALEFYPKLGGAGLFSEANVDRREGFILGAQWAVDTREGLAEAVAEALFLASTVNGAQFDEKQALHMAECALSELRRQVGV